MEGMGGVAVGRSVEGRLLAAEVEEAETGMGATMLVVDEDEGAAGCCC